MTYNLLDEPWIPVLRVDGRTARIGVKTALTEARNIRQISAPNPMDRFAIIRFLLALLYWCEGSPSPERANSDATLLSPQGLSKLDDKKEDFELFGKDRRFYQFGGASNSLLLSANYLLHEIPTGTKVSHFRHSRDRVDGLCPACCAMGLVRLPVFTTEGGRSKGPCINRAPPIYAIPLGESLAETLRLSWVPMDSLGHPAWEQPDVRLIQGGSVTLLAGLTWLPRRVWLEEPATLEKCCIFCGRKEGLVLRTVFEGRGKTHPGTWHDPHVLSSVERGGALKGLRGLDTVKRGDSAAGQWASVVEALLSAQTCHPNVVAPSGWFIVTFSTARKDSYLEAVEWLMPSKLSPNTKESFVRSLKRWERRWDSPALVKRLLPGASEPQRNGETMRLRSLLDYVRPHVEQDVGRQAAAYLKWGEEEWKPSTESYQRMLRLVGEAMFPGRTILAVEMRKRLSEDSSDRTGGAKAKGRHAPKRRSRP